MVYSFTPTATLAPEATPILFPNPLRDDETVHLDIPFDKPHDYVMVSIFTTAFRKIYENTSRFVPDGIFTKDLNIKDVKGSVAADGLYYVVIDIPGHRWITKLLVLR